MNSEPPGAGKRPAIDERLARVDGINGSAGHHLGDPYLRGLLARHMAGDISAEEYDRLGMAHLREEASR